MKNNYDVYNSAELASHYGQAAGLQEPEKAIFRDIGHELALMDVLDVGVGGGRTTDFLMGRVKSYVGTDYAKKMVEICRQRYKAAVNKPKFHVCDVRNMDSFDNECFDFVLFSFNGIDYMNWEERDQSLQEINRVLRKGGYFAFSTHNLNASEIKYTLSDDGIIGFCRSTARFLRLYLVRNSLLKLLRVYFTKYAYLND